MKKPQTPHLRILSFSKKLNSIGKVFNSFEVTRPIKPSPHEKISIPENLTPFMKLQSSHMHMKIEINHPDNIPPPPRNLSNPLNKRNTTEMITTPPEKISNTSESIDLHPPKKLNPSRKNLNLPEKLLLPKNSITITETISNTRTKSQPRPEKSQPLVKNSQSLLKKISTPYPLKFFQPPLKLS